MSLKSIEENPEKEQLLEIVAKHAPEYEQELVPELTVEAATELRDAIERLQHFFKYDFEELHKMAWSRLEQAQHKAGMLNLFKLIKDEDDEEAFDVMIENATKCCAGSSFHEALLEAKRHYEEKKKAAKSGE